jgi:adenylylsulfate kinase
MSNKDFCEQSKIQKGVTIWFTGLSGAGKTTISQGVADRLSQEDEIEVVLLDGDRIRQTVTNHLGFSKEDRTEHLYKMGEIARESTQAGKIVLVAAIAPYRQVREGLRGQIGAFVEVYVKASIEVCEARDPKGLYRRARAGEIKQFTGIDDPYEVPLNPEIICNTDRESIAECVDKVITYLRANWLIQLYQKNSAQI